MVRKRETLAKKTELARGGGFDDDMTTIDTYKVLAPTLGTVYAWNWS